MNTSSGTGASLMPQIGNPDFKAQIDINVKSLYSTVTLQSVDGSVSVGTTSIVDIPASFKQPKPVIMFGTSDLDSGYKNALNIVQPLGGKLLTIAQVKSLSETYFLDSRFNDSPAHLNFSFESSAVKLNHAKKGDLILCYISDEYSDFGGTLRKYTIVELIISCRDVALSTLIQSLMSDTFTIKGVRYSLNDITKLAQFDNVIQIINQTLFGKVTNDSINPNSMKLPSQNQETIIDLPINLQINKNISIGTYLNYDVDSFTFSLFIDNIKKIL